MSLPIKYQENAKWAIEFFAEMMADYMDDPPLYWNRNDVYDLVIHLIPDKSILSKDIFKGFCSILCSFFEFLGGEIIEEDFSKELVDLLKGKDHELMRNAKFTIDEDLN